ncbi:atrial natriuretic peptide receptor 1-like [Babylonia areolata]|uniref:atrial natriuretic peptide receptor 1-like n=1 Tax=Babylonia areolata TaxID=304850 RepID=UPI003FD2E37A
MAPNRSVVDSEGLPLVSAGTSVSALVAAIMTVESLQLLGNHSVRVTWIDSACDAKLCLGRLVDFLNTHPLPDVIIGPPCTNAMVSVADVASYYNVPLFSWLSSEHTVNDKSRATTLVRTLPPLSGLGIQLLEVCRVMGWRRVALVSTEGALTGGVAAFLQDTIDNDEFFFLARTFIGLNTSISSTRLRNIMATLKEEARVIFLIIPMGKLREFLLAAHDEGMTSGDFQFLFSAEGPRPESHLEMLRTEGMWRRNDSRDDDARQAYRNLLYFQAYRNLLYVRHRFLCSQFQAYRNLLYVRHRFLCSQFQAYRNLLYVRHRFLCSQFQAYRNLLYMTFTFILEFRLNDTDVDDQLGQVFDNVDVQFPGYRERDVYARFLYDAYFLFAKAYNSTRDVYARFLYDAYFLFAKAYNSTVSEGLVPDGENLFEAVQDIQYHGLSGFVAMDSNSDRLPSFILWDMSPNNTFREALRLFYYKNESGYLVKAIERTPPGIYWGNGLNEMEDNYVPPDTPACGFGNELCPPGGLKPSQKGGFTRNDVLDDFPYAIIASVCGTAMLIAVIIFFIMYRWWKKEQELHRRKWRVKWTELSFPGNSTTIASTTMHSKLSGSQTSLSDVSEQNTSIADGSALSTLLVRGESRRVPKPCAYCKTAHLDSTRVAVRMIRKKNIRTDRKLLEEMRKLTSLKHVNLASFHGVCVDPPNLCVLWEYCSKGSIQDLFESSRSTDYKLDSMIQISLATDVCAGLAYLHGSEVRVHGNLKSGNCLVDNRWTCKLAGFGLRCLLRGERPDHPPDDQQARFAKLLWTAPESLRQILQGEPCSPTQAADIYSAAIVLKEILCKNQAFQDEMHVNGMTPEDIVSKVSEEPQDTLFRPALTELPDEPATVVFSCVHLVKACWQEDPALRPSARKLLRHMQKLSPYKTYNILDNMVHMMEKYSTRLEELVAQRTAQLEDEKRKTDALLYRMLPRKVAEDLKRGEHVQAEAFTSVTIYFSDIVGFTTIASHSTPMEIVDFLNSLYTVYDGIIREYDVYKVETIGDAYMVVSGIPIPNGTRHVTVMADMALALLQAVFDFVIPHMPDNQLRIRVGLNTGPVVAGVVGTMMPRYCLFGDTVNLASRMESHGVPLKIHLSPHTYDVIKDYKEYSVTERGEIDVKGKGRMRTYFLEGKVTSPDPEAEEEEEEEKKEEETPPPLPASEGQTGSEVHAHCSSLVHLHRSVCVVEEKKGASPLTTGGGGGGEEDNSVVVSV